MFESVLAWYRKWKKERAENKKLQETYRRIDMNKEGKFSQKEYLKNLDAMKKSQMKKNREQTAERKEVKGK